MDNGEICAVFTPKEQHQSYPNRLHGGIAAAVLDETIGRAIMIASPDTWAVTVELTLRYLKPLPLDIELKALARVDKENRLLYEGSGEIYLPDGTLAAKAHGIFMKMTAEKIQIGPDFFSEEWFLDESTPCPKELKI